MFACATADGCLLRVLGLDVDRALLLGRPAFVDQRPVAVPSHLCEPQIGLRLLQRRRVLRQRRLGLRNLMLDLRRRDLHQDVALLDAAADIDVSLGNVSAGAGEDVSQGERLGRARPNDRHSRRARTHGSRQNCRHEVARLFRGRYDFGMKLIMAPGAIPHRAEQNKQRAEPQQATSAAARAAGRRAVLNFTLRLAIRLGFARSEKLNRSNVVPRRHHSNPSANTPCATLPSAPLRSVANR